MTDDSDDSPSGDRILRTMTDDGAFRVMALCATETVRGVCASQNTPQVALELFSDAVMSSLLVRETMAPMLRVELMLRDRLGNQLVGDAWPEGQTRGLLKLADDVLGFQFGEGSLLQIVRNMPRGEQHEGIIEPNDEGGMADALQEYFLRSEQVESMVGLHTEVVDGEIVAAAGYVVQLLPELTDPPLKAMRARLAAVHLPNVVRAAAGDPRALTAAILTSSSPDDPGSGASTELADSPVSFGCRCTPEKVVGAVSLLAVEELQEMVDSGEPTVVRCEYCNTEYRMLTPQIEEVRQRKVDGEAKRADESPD